MSRLLAPSTAVATGLALIGTLHAAPPAGVAGPPPWAPALPPPHQGALGIRRAADVNPDPRVFETTLAAREADVDLDGDGAPERAYTYGGSVPGPELRVRVGDTVIVHFRNELPEASSIHWHGIELNNASDGTPVSQDPVRTGESYSYRFVVPRPGVFWYHPHFKPTNAEFKGQYGPLIVEDPAEEVLRHFGVLPPRWNTKTLMLADTTVCRAPGDNDPVTFPADPELPWSGSGSFPGNALAPTPQQLCEDPLDPRGEPLGTGPLAAGSIPNVEPSQRCGAPGSAVRLRGLAFVATALPGDPGTLYGIDSAGTLYAVDATTAELRELGSTGFDGTYGLDLDPLSQRLWSGSSDARALISIDPATATARIEVSIADFPDAHTRDLAFLADGSLFVVGHSPGTASGARVYRIDRGSGAASLAFGSGQGLTALSATVLLQNFSRLSTVDTAVLPLRRVAIPGWPSIPVATQLAADPASGIVYGINGCNQFCSGELYRYDLVRQTAELIGAPVQAGSPCRASEGQLVLVNGRVPAPRAGTPDAPGAVAAGPRILDVRAGQGLRLQLVNAAVSRYFRLALRDPDGRPVAIQRVGGEGGLLDRVRLEGGVEGALDTKFGRGEILLAPSDRADVVIVPEGDAGDVATLWTSDYEHTALGFARLPTVPLLHLRIAAPPRGSGRPYRIGEGDALLVHPRVGAPTEDLALLPIDDHLLDPAGLPEPEPGSSDEEIRLVFSGGKPTVDDVVGIFDASGPDFRQIPHIASSRFARVGDFLELEVLNQTREHHPFHLHGFSFQPVRMEDAAGNALRSWGHREFADTVDVPGQHRLVFRVRLEDRPAWDGSPTGGAVGRWLFHCHIFFHAGLGMISELVVLP